MKRRYGERHVLLMAALTAYLFLIFVGAEDSTLASALGVSSAGYMLLSGLRNLQGRLPWSLCAFLPFLSVVVAMTYFSPPSFRVEQLIYMVSAVALATCAAIFSASGPGRALILLDCLLYASMALVAVVLLRVSPGGVVDAIFSGRRVGYEVTQPNSVGYVAEIALLLLLAKRVPQSRFVIVLASRLTVPVVALVLVATGSRRAMAIAILGSIAMSLHRRNMIGLAAIGFAGIVAVGTRDLLIDRPVRMFDRVESAVGLFSGGANVNASDNLRRDLVERGLGSFAEKPLFGHGTGSYRSIAAEMYGHELASHNNVVEILVNHGVVGAALFYIPCTWILVKLWQVPIADEEPEARNGLFGLNFTALSIAGMSAITYADRTTMFFIGIALGFGALRERPRVRPGRSAEDPLGRTQREVATGHV